MVKGSNDRSASWLTGMSKINMGDRWYNPYVQTNESNTNLDIVSYVKETRETKYIYSLASGNQTTNCVWDECDWIISYKDYK